MRKLIDSFLGVPNGSIHPQQYSAGEVCPAELEEAAADLGVLGEEEQDQQSGKTAKAPAESKAMKPAENK